MFDHSHQSVLSSWKNFSLSTLLFLFAKRCHKNVVQIMQAKCWWITVEGALDLFLESRILTMYRMKAEITQRIRYLGQNSSLSLSLNLWDSVSLSLSLSGCLSCKCTVEIKKWLKVKWGSESFSSSCEKWWFRKYGTKNKSMKRQRERKSEEERMTWNKWRKPGRNPNYYSDGGEYVDEERENVKKMKEREYI